MRPLLLHLQQVLPLDADLHRNTCVSNTVEQTVSDTQAFPQINLRSLMCGRPRGQTDITPQLGLAIYNLWSAGKKQKVTKMCLNGANSAFINHLETKSALGQRGEICGNVNQSGTVLDVEKVGKPQVFVKIADLTCLKGLVMENSLGSIHH